MGAKMRGRQIQAPAADGKSLDFGSPNQRMEAMGSPECGKRCREAAIRGL